MAFGTVTDITEAKLLILYILKYCGTNLPHHALNEIIIKDNLIEYFVFSNDIVNYVKGLF